jgi:NTE family protein
MPGSGHRKPHRPFAIVFGGGGARGFAHLGVLRGLEREGYHPQLVVGVSMGAVVGVTYASRPDWYEAVLNMDLADFPGPAGPPDEGRPGAIRLVRTMTGNLRVLLAMVMDWGPGTPGAEFRTRGGTEARGPRTVE